MATIATGVQWDSSPKMYFDFSYEKKRDGSTQFYTVTVSCRALTGASYFGYPIYVQIFLDGIEKTLYTLKNASPNQWSSAITYTTDWLAVPNKTSGKTALSIRAYSGMGTTRDITYGYTLDIDPAASSIGATDANIGAISVLSVNRKDAAYTHSVAYQFGGLSGYLADAGGTLSNSEEKLSAVSLSFPIPENFYTQIPNDPSGTCTLTIRTYSGDTLIGSEICNFKVTAAEDVCRPEVIGTVVDVNEVTLALTGDETVLVKGMSTALCTMTTEAKNGAILKSRTIGGVAVTENERTILNIEQAEVLFTATDSRGYTGRYTAMPSSIVEYVPLTCNVTAKRTDPTSGNVSLYIDGKSFIGSFGVADNTLKVWCSIGDGEPMELATQIGESSYEVNAMLNGLDYKSSHRLTVVVEDKLMTVTKTVTVGKGIPVFDWGENDFNFNVPVTIMGHLLKTTDMIYPNLISSLDELDAFTFADGQLHIGYGVINNEGYISFNIGWIVMQFRILPSYSILTRMKYGNSGWGDWSEF